MAGNVLTKPPKCQHVNFHADVDVNRIEGKDKAISGFTADIRVKCNDCGLPFEWVGIPVGSSPLRPMASVDFLELRAPLVPRGELLAPSTQLGFDIRVRREN